MNILKSLDLNKSPQGVPTGSMIFAKNIKVSPDGIYLTNEEGFNLAYDRNIVGKIVGFITCSNEIVIFTDANKIYRLKEQSDNNILKTVEVPSNWTWSGGKIKGDYTYNVQGHLIVGIAEYKDDDTEIPLKSIDLDSSTNDDNKNKYNCAPIIPIANLSLTDKVIGNPIPNGIYYFFIRYEIDKDYYTNWFPIGIPQHALAIDTKTLISHVYDVKHYSNMNTNVVSYYNDTHKDCPYNFKFKISINNNPDYKTFQIGYVLQHDEETIARIWRDFDINTTSFVFDASNTKEAVIDDFVDNVTSLYNVRTITNYENRLYVANYNEVDYNKNLQDYANNIKARITYKSFDDKSGSGSTITKHYIKFTYKGKSLNIEVKDFNTPLKLSECKELLSFLVQTTPRDSYTVDDLLTYHFSVMLKDGKDWCDKLAVTDAYIDISSLNGSVSAALPTFFNLMRKNGSSYEYYAKSGEIKEFDEYGTYDIVIGDTSNTMVGLILTKAFTIERTNDISTHTSNILIDDAIKTLMPLNVYNFFVHYVRADGTYTNGLRINNDSAINAGIYNWSIAGGSITSPLSSITALTCNGINYKNLLSITDINSKYVYELISNATLNDGSLFGYYQNYNGDSLFKTPYKKGYRIGVAFTNISIPDGFVGFFFSYEKPENLNNYQANVCRSNLTHNRTLLRASDVETAAINYLGSVCIPTVEDTPYYISDIDIVTSNNVADSNDMNVLNTIGSNGGIVAKLKLNDSEYYQPSINTEFNIISFNRNIYCSKDKILIPFGPIGYGEPGVAYSYADSTDTNNYPNNVVGGYEFNYPAFYCTDKNLIYERPVYIADDAKVYDIDKDNNIIDKDYTSTQGQYASVYIWKKYSNINLNALSVKKDPAYLVGVLGDVSTKEEKHDKSTNIVVMPLDATDLIEFKDIYKENHPKVYTNFKDNIHYDTYKSNTIRRSDVIQDESNYNVWRHFRGANYKVISRNKGSITNLFGIGNYFYIHTKNTILLMDKSNLIKMVNTNASLAVQDLFEVEPNEVLVGHHGFGGLQSDKAWHLNHIGYWFVDCDNKKIYCFNDNHIQDFTKPIESFFKDKGVDDAAIMTDFENNRVLICIKYHQIGAIAKDYITLSYNYITKSFISLHDYFFTDSIVTKNKCYFHADYDIIQNDIYMFDKSADIGNYETANPGTFSTLTYNTLNFPATRTLAADNVHTINSAIIDVIFNDDYETSKNIDCLRYILNKEYDYANIGIGRMAEPVMENGTFGDVNHYSGDTLRIYTDSCDSGNLDISQHDYAVNQFNDRKKPFFDKGYWNFNYFRNYLYEDTIAIVLLRKFGVSSYDNLTEEQKKRYDELKKNYTFADNKNLIYGRYFVIRFIFNNQDGVPFRLENVDVKLKMY